MGMLGAMATNTVLSLKRYSTIVAKQLSLLLEISIGTKIDPVFVYAGLSYWLSLR